MSQPFHWAVLRDGEVVSLYQTQLGAKCARTKFAQHSRFKWTVKRLRGLFDEHTSCQAEGAYGK